MEKMPKFGKNFEEYMQICGVSLYVCGECLKNYKNEPANIQAFTFGAKFNEATIPIDLSKINKSFENKTKILRDKLEKEKSR